MRVPLLDRVRANRTQKAAWALAERRTGAAIAVVFVHGLGSNAHSTWGKMVWLCEADADLADCALFKFEYPTRKLSRPFSGTLPSLADLAAGLQTEMRLRLGGYDRVLVIAHSMGGLLYAGLSLINSA